MRKIVGLLTALLLALPLVAFSSTAAEAGSCVATSKTNTKTLVMDDGANMQFFVTVKYYDCAGYKIFRSVAMGYRPSGAVSWGDREIWCDQGPIGSVQYVHMNLGDIFGHNPAYKDFGACNTHGESVTYDWADVSFSDNNTRVDRCVGAAVKVALSNWSDWEERVPAVCI